MQSRQKQSKFRSFFTLSAVLLFGVMLGWLSRGLPIGLELSLRSLSPDDRWEVQSLEVRRPVMAIDRNFVLHVKDHKTGTSREIFSSPDEGRPEGSERIIWSDDSTRFLLVGRHFFPNREKPMLTNGDSLYLMYDVHSGELWCNSHQTGYKHFTTADVKTIRWRELLTLATIPTTQP